MPYARSLLYRHIRPFLSPQELTKFITVPIRSCAYKQAQGMQKAVRRADARKECVYPPRCPFPPS